MRPAVLFALVALGLVVAPAAGLNREFNWIPSGTLDVGNLDSEAAARYEAIGNIETLQLGYADTGAMTVDGRIVIGPEEFVIRTATWRLGPIPAHLVICRQIDSQQDISSIDVTINDKQVGTWKIIQPDGPRRLFDACYVVPLDFFPDRKPPAEIRIRLQSRTPSLSLGYRFYLTRDWDVLPTGNLPGDLSAYTVNLDGAAEAYAQGLVAFHAHDWPTAIKRLRTADRLAREENKSELARLARFNQRRARLKMMRQTARHEDVSGRASRQADFEAHFQLGLLAGAWGCWEDALAEYKLATKINPTHADATYRLAEAMEYCRMPIERWAPLMERAGMLGETADCNVEHVLFAVHIPEREGICPKLSLEDLEALQRDWRYVEQQVYGASRGAWKLQTHYAFHGEEQPDWVMQAGWIFLPPDSFADYEGQYQYSIGTAGFGWSHAGGSDCGVAGAGGANVGAQRNWEVFLHEWNHEFDWVFLFAEASGPGYPVTHDSDGCGKQPIVNMGCGHRSSMYYYVNRAQYMRHRGTDPVNSAGFVQPWRLGPLIEAPDTDATSADALATWLIENGHFTQAQIDGFRRNWEGEKKREADRKANPNAVPHEPPAAPVPDWPGYLRDRWDEYKMIDRLKTPLEDEFVAGEAPLGSYGKLYDSDASHISAAGEFVDLLEHVKDAPQKCAVYTRTYLYSPIDQEVRLWIGYNDCGIVWLNGRQLSTGRYYACAKWDDANRPYMLAMPGHLQRGWNCLAMKVERGGGDWGYSLHVVDRDNNTIDGLRTAEALPAGETCNVYTPPEVGPHYRWADVKDDYLERLPRLDDGALQKITGIDGLKCAPHRFLLMLPPGIDPVAGSRFIGDADDDDTALNNYLNWDIEAACALRYEKNGQTRDLVVVRPEYFEEYLRLLDDELDTPPHERLLGYLWLEDASYSSTPNRPATRRAAIVLEAKLGEYPADDLGVLGLREK